MDGWKLTPGKTRLSFETIKNLKLLTQFFAMNSFYDKDDILQKKN